MLRVRSGGPVLNSLGLWAWLTATLLYDICCSRFPTPVHRHQLQRRVCLRNLGDRKQRLVQLHLSRRMERRMGDSYKQRLRAQCRRQECSQDLVRTTNESQGRGRGIIAASGSHEFSIVRGWAPHKQTLSVRIRSGSGCAVIDQLLSRSRLLRRGW
jgi:hypothetical protein